MSSKKLEICSYFYYDTLISAYIGLFLLHIEVVFVYN